jgi:hypothetical protein
MATEATTEATASAKATCKAATRSKTATTTKWTAKATTSATETTTPWEVVREAILTNIQQAALPIVTIELLNSVASVIWRLEGNNTRALWTAIWTNVHIGTDHVALTSCHEVRKVSVGLGYGQHTSLTEQVLQILPANSVWQL